MTQHSTDEAVMRFKCIGIKREGIDVDRVTMRIQRIEEEGKAMIKRALLTCATDKYDAKDRSGKLALYEPPDLAQLVTKILS